MVETYTLELTAQGENGEELSTTAEVEATDPDAARDTYREQVDHVDYWDITIERVTEANHG